MQTVSGALGSSGFRDSDLGLRVDALFCGVPEDPGVMEFLHLLQSKSFMLYYSEATEAHYFVFLLSTKTSRP